MVRKYLEAGFRLWALGSRLWILTRFCGIASFNQAGTSTARSESLSPRAYFAAIFLTMAKTNFRSLSFRLAA